MAPAAALASPMMPTSSGTHAADLERVDVDLDDLGVLGPVVDAPLRQGAEAAEAGADGEDHVGLGDEPHGGLRALVAERADGELVAARVRVGVHVRGGDRRVQQPGHTAYLVGAGAVGHAGAGDDHRVLRRREDLGGAVERCFVARAARGHAIRARVLRDVDVDLVVEVVARHVHLHRAVLGHGDAEGGAERLGDAVGARHLHLELGDRLEDRAAGWSPGSRPCRGRTVIADGVMTMTGEWACQAAAMAVTMLVMPGPFWPVHTLGMPVTRA